MALAAWMGVRWLRTPDESIAEHGRRVAESLGCFACHGPGGSGGVFNPGSESGEVPAWSGGTVMMYAENEAEIREWILDGAPRRLKASASHLENRKKSLLAMPAYRDRVSDPDLEALLAYFAAVSWVRDPPDAAAHRGRELAFELGCFGCHGASGALGNRNPGSFKGIVPAWTSNDFAALVENDEELEEWILDGVCKRLKQNPVARRFLDNQVISMPAYRSRIDGEQLRALKAFISWVRSSAAAPTAAAPTAGGDRR